MTHTAPRENRSGFTTVRTSVHALLVALLACRQGSPGPGKPHDTSTGSVTVDERACLDMHDDVACRRAALAAIGAHEDARALRLAARACDHGHLLSCKTLGWLYENGRGTTRDPVRARVLYARACDGGELSSCKSLGLLLDLGLGGAVDRRRAAELYARACVVGELDACNNLANLYATGDGIPRDPSRAATLYQHVCTARHDARACGNAAAARARTDAAMAHD